MQTQKTSHSSAARYNVGMEKRPRHLIVLARDKLDSHGPYDCAAWRAMDCPVVPVRIKTNFSVNMINMIVGVMAQKTKPGQLNVTPCSADALVRQYCDGACSKHSCKPGTVCTTCVGLTLAFVDLNQVNEETRTQLADVTKIYQDNLSALRRSNMPNTIGCRPASLVAVMDKTLIQSSAQEDALRYAPL
jgi:hypothetical protein